MAQSTYSRLENGFTFQYGEIKRFSSFACWFGPCYLHSSMERLKAIIKMRTIQFSPNLHSSMERLKGQALTVQEISKFHLHSSMERLKGLGQNTGGIRRNAFTFQYGEIKSVHY